jgi:spore germination cell wall hydrolase CwlJ-like protein
VNSDSAYWSNVILLALCAWREARGEIYTAKLAVAYTVVTRVAHGGWWGASIMGVLRCPDQYTSLTHAGDPNLVAWPAPADPFWADSVQAAVAALSRSVPNPAPMADSYFSGDVEPYWAASATFVAQVGDFRFYRTV